jgi:type II restriction enzyme
VICDFCGYVAQVKAVTSFDIEALPKTILGAAWSPQSARMQAGIFIPLFLVLTNGIRKFAIYYLAGDLQLPEMFKARAPLSESARRAGWQGFLYDLTVVKERIVRVH